MNIKTLAVHGILAVLALAAAYLAWRHDRTAVDSGEELAEEIEIAGFTRADLKTITYRSEKRTVQVELSESGEPPHWVTVTTKLRVRTPPAKREPTPPEPVSGDGGPGAGDAGLPETGDAAPIEAGDAAPPAPRPTPEEPRFEEKTLRFVGNKALDEIVKRLAPLKVSRRFGKLGSEQLEEFELHEPQASLVIGLADGERSFKVGGRTFGAGSHYYVLDDSNGEAYLMSSKIIRELEGGQSRLMQRELHRFEASDAAKATVTAGDQRRSLIHRNRHNLRERVWVDAGDPERVNKAVSGWMGQLGRLRALSYPDPDDSSEPPPALDATPLFRVEYADQEGANLGFVEVSRTGTPNRYYGRSELTGNWVAISRPVGDELFSRLDTFFD